MLLNGKKLLLSIVQLLLASGAIFFLYEQSSQDSATGNLILVVYALLVALVISIIYSLFNNSVTSPADKISKIIIDGSDELDDLSKTIFRLKAYSDDDNRVLITALSSMLEKIHHKFDAANRLQSDYSAESVKLKDELNELTNKYQLLKQEPHQRSEFLSLMGDEITSPMQSLNSMLKLLNKAELDQESSHLLKIAIHSAYSLTENITNILEFTKLDANLLSLEPKPFDLYESISQVLETQESIALSKSLFIEKHISADVPKQMIAPEKAIMKVLNNLISNAIRFTDRGSINLNVDRIFRDDKAYIRFKVSDTGVGVPSEALGTLFDSLDKNTQLKNSSFTGRLRLIVSKGLCELMGGEIGATSSEGNGSEFWFTVRIKTN